MRRKTHPTHLLSQSFFSNYEENVSIIFCDGLKKTSFFQIILKVLLFSNFNKKLNDFKMDKSNTFYVPNPIIQVIF